MASIPTIKMNTKPVTQLHVLARQMDEVTKSLYRVQALENEFPDRKKFVEIDELSKKAASAVVRVRDTIGKKSGSVVAKGYK